MKKYCFITLLLLPCLGAFAQRQMENLDRGLIAVNEGNGKVFLSWRMLGTEPDNIAYNLYHLQPNKAAVKLNPQPIADGTNFTEEGVDNSIDNTWFVKPVVNGKELNADKPYTLKASSAANQYLNIPLHTPAGYTPNDVSVGDLDGDGEYELVVHQTGKGRDNSQSGFTDAPILQAYKLDGTFLWQINLGKNIREGAHYTQFMVYDLDGDGNAQLRVPRLVHRAHAANPQEPNDVVPAPERLSRLERASVEQRGLAPERVIAAPGSRCHRGRIIIEAARGPWDDRRWSSLR